MTTYSYGQLEDLWISAGGSKALAPLMAAIALAESGGNPAAMNYTDNNGTQTSVGLWQVSTGTHSYPAAWTTPAGNAAEAVAKYNSQGLTAWGTYDSGAYKQFYKSGVPPSKLPQGGSGGGGGGGSGNGTQSANEASFTSTLSDVMQAPAVIIHDAAETLNFFFEFFKPGQAERIGFGAVAAGSAALAVRSYGITGQGGSSMPLAVAFTGGAFLTGYMALRPWPQSGGRPIRAAAYVHDIFGGHPPSGPPPSDDTAAIEAGLTAVFAIWAISKAAGAVGGLGNLVSGAVNGLSSLWNVLKNLGGDVAEAGGAE